MKKYALSALFLLTMSIGALPENSKAASEEENDSGVSNFDTDYMENKEYYDELAKQRDLEIAEREKREREQGLARAAAYYTIPVTYNKQAYTNFCGPAAGRQALSFHKAKSKSKESLPSQENFGVTIGVLPEKGPTRSTDLRNGLNKYKNVYSFSSNPYIVGRIIDSKDPQTTFISRITDTLKEQKTAPILLTETEWIKQYKGTNYRHYVTISGYKESDKTLRVVDPNHHTEFTGTGTYWTSIGSATDTTTDGKGIAKAVYIADGANPAMIW
ncbi:C39 family peptidase [Lysinibacillus sp. G4S2]|uniref:C39 family peptidase n=1 Tax=Lysinibacillus sp. G4S2 TaxID=3055859 RepID=UPI0025A0B1F5|nr:C39 family peptidase [Lysinibacillus sp. G4S2]MDM5248723.1 C39 family peptidase [Lysinibacillus sp. G4S2]